MVVAEVGIWIVGDNRKENDYRKAKEISTVDCHVEGRIILDPHGALHPVNNAFASEKRALISTDLDARTCS
jgi:hypothetical protein